MSARAQQRPWLVFAGAALLAVALYYAIPTLGGQLAAGIDTAVPQAFVYDALSVASALAIMAGIRLHRPSLWAPWALLAASGFAFAAGDVLWDVLSLGLHEEPFPSVADVAYLTAYPLLVAALSLFVARRVPRQRWRWFADLGIIVGGLSLVLWLVMVEPILAESDVPFLERAVSLAYPIADMGLLAVLVSASLSPRPSTLPDLLLGGGLVALLVADVAFAMFPDLQSSGGPLDAVYLLRYVLFGTAALHPAMREVGQDVASDRLLTTRRLVVLAATALLPPAMLALEAVLGLETHLTAIAIAWVVLTVLVLLDVLGLIRDQQAAIARRQALEGELFEARRLESIGRLAGGIAHDFNNILTAIIGFADLAVAEAPKADVESLRRIRESAQRAAALVQKLLAFGGRQVMQPRPIRLVEAIGSVEPVLRKLLGEGVEVTLVLPADPVVVVADHAQLDQVLLNLALNACDAMPDGGRLTVALSTLEVDETTRPSREMRPGSYALLSVGDTGPGMNAEALAHVFEPFFPTKPAGRGSGLELATVYGIVRQSGGFVDVRSEPGAGTIFEVYLPLAGPGVEADAAERPDAETPSPSPTAPRVVNVLVVEDEPAVRDLAARILRDAGYRVATANGPVEAVESICAGARVDVLLTDIVMPAMSGFELARQVRTLIRPNLPVVVMSGYAEAMSSNAAGELSFLPKPFSASGLLTAVAESLP